MRRTLHRAPFLDRGRTVRMVEEGHPEVVIPLAPHRRDRAKSLLSHTASMIGMAAGGLVHRLAATAAFAKAAASNHHNHINSHNLLRHY